LPFSDHHCFSDSTVSSSAALIATTYSLIHLIIRTVSTCPDYPGHHIRQTIPAQPLILPV
jgi:hypothetical protein